MNPTSSLFHFHLDSPSKWALRDRGLICRGWAFERNGAAITGVRLRSTGQWIEGTHGGHRPDVRAAFPIAPNDNTGWEIRALLPPGFSTIDLEFRDSTGTWGRVFSVCARVRRTLCPKWAPWHNPIALLDFQMPAHAVHAPRIVRPDSFPKSPTRPAQLPSISIVTPSLNQSWALEDCLDSVIPAPELDLTHVVQDGGSTDGSAALLEARTDRLHAWASTPDNGQAAAIVRGFEKTSGRPTDLMAWINSDDFYPPGALRFVAEYFAQHPEVDVVYGHRIVVDRDGQEIARWFLPPHDDEVLRLNDFVPQETLFWRRRIWDKVGGIDTSFQFALDWDLLLRFQAAEAKIVRIPYFLGCFRVHSQQKTRTLLATTGQQESNLLRERTFGRKIAPEELESSPALHRYLRKSAWLEFLWRRFGLRGR